MSSVRPALPNRNQTRVYSKAPIRTQGALTCDEDYVETEFYADPESVHQSTQQQPSQPIVAMTPSVSVPAVQSSKPAAKKGKGYLIVLGVVLLLCASAIAVVAVVLFRPTMAESVEEITSQIQQIKSSIQEINSKMGNLEQQFTAVQGFNYSLDRETLSSLSSAQELMETNIEELGMKLGMRIQALNSSQMTAVASLSQSQESMETDIRQWNTIQTATNSLLNTVQTSVNTVQNNFNTVQSNFNAVQTSLSTVQNNLNVVSAVQGNIREDLDQLHSVDLYRGCTTEIRECALTTGGSSSQYWIICATPYITVDDENQDGNNYVTNVWCDVARTSYMEVFHIYRTGNSIRCECQVIRPSSSSSSFSALPWSYSTTCTLRVMKCPRSVNLLAQSNNS